MLDCNACFDEEKEEKRGVKTSHLSTRECHRNQKKNIKKVKKYEKMATITIFFFAYVTHKA